MSTEKGSTGWVCRPAKTGGNPSSGHRPYDGSGFRRHDERRRSLNPFCDPRRDSAKRAKYAPLLRPKGTSLSLRSSPQRNRQSVEVGRDDQPGLAPDEREHRAVLVGEHDRARAAPERGPHAARPIHAGDVGRTADVADGPAEIDFRGAEG